METARIGKDKKLSRDVKGYHSEKNSLGEDLTCTPMSVGDGEDDDLGGPGSNPRRLKNVYSLQRGKGGNDEKIRNSDRNTHNTNKLSEKDNGGTHQVPNRVNQVSGRGKSGIRENDKDFKDDRILDLYRKYDDVKGEGNAGDLERRKMENGAKYFQVQKELQQSVRWIKDQASSAEKKMGESQIRKSMEGMRGTHSYRNVDVVKSGKGNRYSRTEESVSYVHSTEMQKKQPQQNKTWAKGRVDYVEKPCINKGTTRRENFHKTNFATKTGESEIYKSMLEGESFNKTNVQRKMAKSKTNDSFLESDTLFRSHVEEKMGETELNKHKLEYDSPHRTLDGRKPESFYRNKKGTVHEIDSNDQKHSTYADGIGKKFRDQYRSQRYVRLHKGSAEVEELGPRDNEIRESLSRNYVHVRNGSRYKISMENEKVRGPSQVLMKDEDDNDLEMDRKAFKSFEVFTDVRGRPRVLRMEMEERIQKLAKWLNGTDVDMPEWQFSKIMHSAKIRFTDHSILRVVQILGVLGNWRRVLQVVEWLQSHDRFKSYKSRYIYTTVLNVLGKAKRPVEALNVFHAMRQQFSSYPDLAAYHCITVTLGQAGYMKELFDVIDCMRALPQKKFKTGLLEKWDPRLEPDAVVYNAVLNACVHRKQWEGAFWVLQQLKQQRIQPSSTTYGLVMEVMFACGKYSLVHEFFRKVEKTSIPNTLNYKVLVNTLWREGKTDEAVLVVLDMERRGIVGSASLYYDLARCLCSAGRCQEALQQINKICKVAKKPLVVTYTGLIQACLESGSVQNGAYIFNQMHEFCSPNTVTCNIMLKAYVKNKMFEEAKALFQKILDGTNCISSVSDYKESIIPDKFTFNTMLEACAEEKRWDDYENFYRRMLHHGYHFNPKRHLRMILEASRDGKGQSLDTTWDHLVRSGRNVPLSIIKERFCMKLREDELDAALSCISCDQMSVPHTISEKAWFYLLNSNADLFQKDMVARLLNEVNTLVSESGQPNPIYQNLVSSCREFVRTHISAAATSPSVNGRTPSEVEVKH